MTTQSQRRPPPTWWWRRGLPSLGLAVGCALIITAGVESAISVAGPASVGTVPAVRTPARADPAGPNPEAPVQLAPTAIAGEIPQRLALPALQMDAPIVPVGVLPGGGLVVPDNPHVLGWWQAGAHPGSGQGTVVIDGHVDTAADGPGALFELRELRPGDPVALSTDRGLRSYVIVAVRSYLKADLPAEVFADSGQPRLVIVTCGGAFNKQTRQYANNIVAYAVPASATPPASAH